MKLYLLSILVFFGLAVQAGVEQVCNHIFVRDGKFRLNKNEKIIICGTSQVEAWKEVPLEQAQIEIKALLQKKGYFAPVFERQNENLIFELGPRTKIEHWTLDSANPVLNQNKKRKVIGETMTPEKLDEIEKWAEADLKSRGFACPKIENKARVWDSTVETFYETGPQLRISSLERRGMEALDVDAMKRFEAFEVGDLYDNRNLQITSNRLLSDGIAQSSYYTQDCTPEGVKLVHHMEVGEPRILRVGIGASTEEFPFLDAWFKNTRIDGRASSYWLLLHASPRIQSLEGASELYIIPTSKRTFLGPKFRVARKMEASYETLSGKTGLDVGRLWDWHNSRFDLRGGPALNYQKTVQGFGPADVSYVTVEGTLNTMSHDYELTGIQQFEGSQASLSYQGQRKGLGSPLSAELWSLRAKNLWNIQGKSPPLLILGSRFEGNITTTEAETGTNDRTALPNDYRIFLGGEQNLRGFSRQSINNNGLGYLTSAYLGLELRLIEELPWNLEPLVLWDGARVGDVPWHLEGPSFQSIGGGLRWRSPLGPIRFTIARGYITAGNDVTEAIPEQWNFLFSFGREF